LKALDEQAIPTSRYGTFCALKAAALSKSNPKEALVWQSRYNEILLETTEKNERKTSQLLETVYLTKINLLKQNQEQQSNLVFALKRSNRQQQAVLLLLTLLSMGVIAFIIYYFRNKSKMMDQNIQLKINQEERLKLENELKQKEITNLALSLKNQSKVNEEAIALLKKVEEEGIDQAKILIDQLKQRQYVTIERDLLQTNIQELSQQFYHELKTKHPSLTKNEQEICGLIKIGLTNKEIAQLRSVEPKSVAKAKFRIKQKMNLDAETDLFAYISSF
jgi:DNA-binding NarL/FixJ family response regulator